MPPKPGYRRKNYDLEPSANEKGPRAREPHSSWQLIIEKRRKEKSVSIRSLADSVELAHCTLFNWLRAASGAPQAATYTKDLNKRVAKALDLDSRKLWDAFEISTKPAKDASYYPTPTGRSDLGSERKVIEELLSLLRFARRSKFSVDDVQLLSDVVLSKHCSSV